jgi:hypothetical protein
MKNAHPELFQKVREKLYQFAEDRAMFVDDDMDDVDGGMSHERVSRPGRILQAN